MLGSLATMNARDSPHRVSVPHRSRLRFTDENDVVDLRQRYISILHIDVTRKISGIGGDGPVGCDPVVRHQIGSCMKIDSMANKSQIKKQARLISSMAGLWSFLTTSRDRCRDSNLALALTSVGLRQLQLFYPSARYESRKKIVLRNGLPNSRVVGQNFTGRCCLWQQSTVIRLHGSPPLMFDELLCFELSSEMPFIDALPSRRSMIRFDSNNNYRQIKTRFHRTAEHYRPGRLRGHMNRPLGITQKPVVIRRCRRRTTT